MKGLLVQMKISHPIKIFFFFLLIFSSSFIVIALPPGQALGNMKIIYPKIDTIQVNTDFYLHLHAFNELGELINNTNYNCIIHIYGPMGSHEIQTVMGNDINGIDKEYIFNSSNNNEIGQHSYNILCVSPNEAGAISEPFTVTRTGLINGIGDFPLIFGVLAVVIVLLIVSATLNDKHGLLKLLIQFFALYFLYLIPTLTLSNISGVPLTFFKLYNWFIKILWIYIFGYLIYELLNYMGKLTKIKNGFNNITRKYKRKQK